MEWLIGVALCFGGYYLYQGHQRNVQRECVNNVAYRLMDKFRLGHTDSKRSVMAWDTMSRLLTEAQLAKDTKRSLSADERREMSTAATLASGDSILTAVGLYPGTKEHWRSYRALMDLAVSLP